MNGVSTAVCMLCMSAAAFAQDANLAQNPGFEESGGAGAWQWEPIGSGYKRVGYATAAQGRNVAEVSHASASQERSGAMQRITLDQTEPHPVVLSAMIMGLDIEDDPNDRIGASLYCRARLRDGTFAFCPTTPKTKNVGTFLWRKVTYNTALLVGAEGKPIDYIDVRLELGPVSGTAWFDDVKAVEARNAPGGAVTFMFDDGDATTYAAGFEMLRRRNFRGVVASVVSYIGRDGFMTLDHIRDLVAADWEVVSHGFRYHDDMTAHAKPVLESEFRDSLEYFRVRGFDVKHFALPKGGYNAGVVAAGQRYYASVRSTDRGDNPRGMPAQNVRVQEPVDSTGMETVRSWIERARSRGTWLVLVFHDIGGAPGAPYSITADNFSRVVDLVAESGLPVVTYDEGVRRMTIGASR